MINAENLNPNRSGFQYKNVTGTLTTEFYGKVNTKLVRAGNLLRGTLAIRKADLTQKKKEQELQSRNRFEDRLESNPNVEKRKDLKNRIPRPGSGVGILGWFKNFIGSVALGFFATRLLGSLPLFTNILKGVMGVVDFVASTGIFLVNAASTFINLGYNAYDSTRGFLKQIGGDNVTQIFDTFINRASSLIDVLIIASIIRGSGGGGIGLGDSVARRGRGLTRSKGVINFGALARQAKEARDLAKIAKNAKRLRTIAAGAVGAGAAGGALNRLRRRQRLKKEQAKLSKTISEERARKKIITDRARAGKIERQEKLKRIPAAQDAVLVRKYIDAGDIGSRTTIPEVRTLKRIDRLDDLIERNEIAGNKKAAKRNLEERDALVKKLQKRQALRTRNKVIIGETERLAREDAMRDISADRPKKVRGGRVQQYSDKGLQRLSQAVSKTKSSSITSRGIAKIPDRLMLKLFGRRIARAVGGVPIVGGLLDFAISIIEGDPLPKAAFRATAAGLGGALGLFLGGLTGPLAPLLAPVGAFLVGTGADALASFVYDTMLTGFFPSSKGSTGNMFTNFFGRVANATGGFLQSIWNFITGKKEAPKYAGFAPIGGFIEDRPGYKKPTTPETQTQTQTQSETERRRENRRGTKRTPVIPKPKTTTIDKKVNFSSLFDLVTSGEGGLNSVNRGTAGDTRGGARSIFGKDLTDMTVDEVYGHQRAGRVSAVGKYQIIPTTMTEFIQYLRSQGIDTSKRKFDASIQNMFGPYSITQKREKVGRFLKGDTGVDLDTAQLELAAEFASVGVPYDMKKGSYNGKFPLRDIKKGESLYSEIGGNYAPAAHTEKVRSMLRQLREQASYEKSDSTVVVNSSTIAKNIPIPVPTNNQTVPRPNTGGNGYDPFSITYMIG